LQRIHFFAPIPASHSDVDEIPAISCAPRPAKTEKTVEIDPATMRICQKNHRALKGLSYKNRILERLGRSKQNAAWTPS
jgi:hypothetical protein